MLQLNKNPPSVPWPCINGPLHASGLTDKGAWYMVRVVVVVRIREKSLIHTYCGCLSIDGMMIAIWLGR